ncbi:MAG: D-alanine--D-alanine ligase, partial [Spirochaetales bacterium]|nr:D-alanine--D-alanine ligase [Spirochaetales bacterium]
IPADLKDEESARVREIAEKAYAVLGCCGMSRVDFFMDKDSGEFFLNEINTIPGFTSISMFAKMCDAGGLPYAELLDRLIVLGMEKFREKRELTFTLN